MKQFSKLVLLTAATAASLCAPCLTAADLAGFVFVNAVGIKDKVDITADGRRLTSHGIAAGIASSGLGLPAGSYQVKVTAPDCETATAPVQLAVGTTPILIAYLERVTDPKTNKTTSYIRLLQVMAESQTEKYVINALSVDPTEIFTVTAGGQTQPVEFRKPVRFEGKSVKVTATGSTDQTSADEKGNYYCVLFKKFDVKVGAILVPEKIYRW